MVRVCPLTFLDDLLNLLCGDSLLLVLGVETGFFLHHLDYLLALYQVLVFVVVDLVKARRFLALFSVYLIRLLEGLLLL